MPPAPSAAPVADAPPAVVPTVPAVAASGGTTPAVAVPPAPVRVGPAFLHTSTPAYPEELRRAGVEGSVVVVVHVDTDGRPQTVSVERSSGHVQFDRNAVEAVRRDYRFRPAREDDRAVEADVRFTVPFRLSE